MKVYNLSFKILAFAAIFSFVFTFSCRSKKTGQTDANGTEPNAAVKSSSGDIAVTVNGKTIKESQIEEIIAPILQKNTQMEPAVLEQNRKMIRESVLNQLIEETLLDEKIAQANIEVTEKEVIDQITEMAQPMSLEDVKKKLIEDGRSFDELKNDIKQRLAYRKFIEAQSVGTINVTEADAKKYYDENPKQFQQPEEVRASHILVMLKPEGTDVNAAKAKAKEKIQGLLQKIKDGADLAELAKANSDCPSAKDGGDLNYFPRGMMTEPFEKAAFELEVGKISDIVETDYGYHIIKVTDHRQARVLSFEDAKVNIIEELTQQKKAEFANEYIESLKKEANIVYPPGKEPQPLKNL